MHLARTSHAPRPHLARTPPAPRTHSARISQVLAPGAEQWEAGPSLRGPRFSAAAASVGERVYVLGGCEGDGQGASAVVEARAAPPAATALWAPLGRHPNSPRASGFWQVLEEGASFWEEAPAMRSPRMGACASGLEGRLCVVGGLGRDGGLAGVQTFDPQCGVWEEAPPLAVGRVAACAVAMRV